MTPIYLASPFNGPDHETIRQNIVYARLCILDSLARGEAPYASHLLYTQVLDESPENRERGLLAGDAMRRKIGYVVAYIDLGITGGMKRAKEQACAGFGRYEERRLPRFAGMTEERVRVLLLGFPLEDFPALGVRR